ncbi:restriction endonuclease subunit S [Methylobacterium sp. Leaf469]|uniref:restriction endonuclease subunit S n=1 Tax=Methylobacterium sp. Leaf469 TaxID=1736387 RepID=UPI00138F51D3|nr:restriction endonuclease subunit S [Methylobacterium sp. Leaf469]
MPDRAFNYISLEDIEAGTGQLFQPNPTLGRNIASAKTRFHTGDLLYGRLRPYLQKVIIAGADGIAATELLVLRVNEGVETEFIQEVLLGPDHQASVSQIMSGARMPRIRADQLLNLQIALPPIEVQRVIVRGLGVHRHRINSLRARIAGSLELVTRLEQQLLTSAFDGSLSARVHANVGFSSGTAMLSAIDAARRATWEDARNSKISDVKWMKRSYTEAASPALDHRLASLPTTWAWASLEQLASATNPICYGIVEPGEDIEIGVPMVRIQDLTSNGINLSGVRSVTPEIDERHARSRLQGGEVLVSLAGSIGRIARVPEDLAGANINRALAKVTPIDADMGEWIALALQSPVLQEWLNARARGAARDILNVSMLVRAPIPVAPLVERRWLVEQLKHRFKKLASLRTRLQTTDTALNSLWTQLRAKVLAGDISLLDPTDGAVAAAFRARLSTSDGKQRGARRKAKKVTINKLKFGIPNARLDLRAVLENHADGLEPLRLLEEAGYGLQDVEVFFKNLAEAVAAGTIQEYRSEMDWPRLVAA